MRIVADDKIPFLKGVLEPFAEVVYLPGDQISSAALKNTDALLTRSITKCNSELLDNTSVKLIASATIGDDHIDKKYCADNDIVWNTAKGCNAAAVEQYITSALLHLAQKENFELSAKTIGIIGVGNIGKRVARVAGLLGMEVLLNDPPRERNEGSDAFTSINQIQAKSDMITLHVPLINSGQDKTFHLFDEDFIKGINENCVLLNTCRGEVVESAALKKAIEKDSLKHTIIDVWENEPKINQELLGVVDIATPHIAGYSLYGKANGTAMIVKALSKHFNLGLEQWYPDLKTEKLTIEIDGSRLSDQEIAYEVFKHAYPISEDDKALRNNSDNFEKLRREYIFREENNSFILNLKNVNSEIIDLLKKLGFIIQKSN